MKKFGRLPKKEDPRTLKMGAYLQPAFPLPPASFSVLQTIYPRLNQYDPATLFTLFPMDANDQYGDCTCAALAHADTCFNGLLGKLSIMAEADVVTLYMKLTGGQDTGMAELDVLKYWKSNSVQGDQIISYVSIDPKNHTMVQQAIATFGGVYLGMNCQENAMNDFDAGVTWEPGTLTNDGHAVFAVEYDQETVTVLTWGDTQKGSWAWWDACVEECYAILPPEAQNTQFAPGFDFEQLQADINLL